MIQVFLSARAPLKSTPIMVVVMGFWVWERWRVGLECEVGSVFRPYRR